MAKNNRTKSEHGAWGHTRKGCGSSPSHRSGCQAHFKVAHDNKVRSLERQVRKHPNDLQAAARLKELR